MPKNSSGVVVRLDQETFYHCIAAYAFIGRVGLNHLEEQNSSTDWLTCLLEPYCFYYH